MEMVGRRFQPDYTNKYFFLIFWKLNDENQLEISKNFLTFHSFASVTSYIRLLILYSIFTSNMLDIIHYYRDSCVKLAEMMLVDVDSLYTVDNVDNHSPRR